MNLADGMMATALLAALWRATAPILLAALAGMVSERAGVINVALEGLMLVAAFFGVMGSVWAAQGLPAWPPALHATLGALLGLAASVALALLLGLCHLRWGADLIVAGIGINLLAAGATVFLLVLWAGDKGSTAHLASAALPALHLPGFTAWPWLDSLLNGDDRRGHHGLVWVAFAAVPLLHALLMHTRFGLRLRASGEAPEAAAAAGLPVDRLRYAALALSGLLAGLGGLYLSMGYLTLFQADMSGGRGFIALAAVFLGGRTPLGVLGAALLFGACAVAATQLGLLNLPPQAVQMLPALATLAAMLLFGLRQRLLWRRREAASLARWQSGLSRAAGATAPSSDPVLSDPASSDPAASGPPR
ncbi:ABC transporter permease [Aquabacterium sp.]|uniref:ABC transporter permease n=1 Tax=Aquabacterium sp. TaxID=1872578 RepID=UPI002C133F95|nr:ABC transporter permease [Aquabacterium sp.]HSW04075.1 ABC transporter permease [Aquabacterium sp.]